MKEIPIKLENLAKAKFRAWNDYYDTGEDHPAWPEWLEQMKEIVGKKKFRISVIAHSVKVAYGN